MFEYHGFMLNESISFLNLRFENDVKTYGTQAMCIYSSIWKLFENDVKTYGTQADLANGVVVTLFENDVKTYGTQATVTSEFAKSGLRMM